MKKEDLIIVLVCLSLVVPCEARVVYVNTDAIGNSDGTSWQDAYKFLQDALADANSNDDVNEIRVAQGIYTQDCSSADPSGSGNREATFQFISGVALYGGFSSSGNPNFDDRDPNVHVTILSGDLYGNDAEVDDPCDLIIESTRADNSFHVVIGSGLDILEGFTITGGNANGTGNNRYGGGVYKCFGSIVNCKVTCNSAVYGGGVYECYGSIINCVITKNAALDLGGGIKNCYGPIKNCVISRNDSWRDSAGLQNCHGLIDGCLIVGNRALAADSGGVGGGGTLVNCIVSGNWAQLDGGGMGGSYEVSNCIISGNRAGRNGGAVRGWGLGSGTLRNCTIVGNWAGQNSGAIHYFGQVVDNCIIWDNHSNDSSALGLIVTPLYSCIEGGSEGLGCIGTDPRFVSPGSWTDPCGTPSELSDDIWVDGDYHPKSEVGRWDPCTSSWVQDAVTSPCIDAGDPYSDWTNELWPHGGRINMGSYGGTPQASMSLSSIGNVADLNNDGSVDFLDLDLFGDKWSVQKALLSQDMDRNGIVDGRDYAIIALNWFWE
jgi:hypothetical protein